jgi:hypothetical protein
MNQTMKGKTKRVPVKRRKFCKLVKDSTRRSKRKIMNFLSKE